MSQVPLSMNQLETIVEVVSRDLLEQWAINDRFKEDEMVQAAQNSVDDTVFVINAFMEHFNTYMMTKAKESGINL
jgi:hypothetical protein